MDRNLRDRIIISLQWLVDDAKYRFDECRLNFEQEAKGGYSPELTEAIEALKELKKTPANPTLEDCKNIGYAIGLTDEKSTEFFHQYNRQGWLFGNGLPVTDLISAMVSWRNNQYQFGDKKITEPQKNRHGLTPRQKDIQEKGR